MLSMPPKPKRFQHQRCLHFITFSCYRRRKLLDTPAARETFEKELERVRGWYGCYVTGYVVMPEPVHLLISEPERKQVSVVLRCFSPRLSVACPLGVWLSVRPFHRGRESV